MSQDDPDQNAARDATQDASAPAARADVTTVEALVRKQLSEALGGRRGMLEAAAPTILFTGTWLATKELQTALVVSISAAVLLLVVRLVQRSTVQFCVNALVGIAIGWFFVNRAAAAGGTVEEQALAYFLPGILYNAVYAVVLGLSCVTRWPLVGFMVGSVTGDPTAWRSDPQVVRLTSVLTWVLAAPCVLRVVVQAPIYLAGTSGAMDADAAVATLGLLKIGLGWPLQLGALAWMVWLLGRNHTPLEPAVDRAPEARA
ncbi:DUF3159 domain-containing protein [Nocardioides daphniae]|uniref:DUF3159 domain-containing protein n=1 Tax=Nocardioides daphniae TaxID=402297 RepID=A0A4P7UCL8_9ACTN|nr:DUF3159 domain-containing protein [Nocardioides daphniae]QCC77095.1 DUF3159 domain-containing protein [Nocardioides daphniae]GGD19561.1 hypothetical protein GCM10007231_18410 [Nocardioides daphniae]